jgi:hypothetical protein
LGGEAERFTLKQQNILLRFKTVFFLKMTQNDCDEIFAKLVPSSISDQKEVASCISNLHASV